MRESAKTLIDQWATPLIVAFGAITCLNLVGLGAALLLIAGQAHEGGDARARQQAVYPVSLKLYTWAETIPESGITQQDLACFKTGRHCPPAKRTP